MYKIAMLSVHTCPMAMLGGKETGGMNVYVRDLPDKIKVIPCGVDSSLFRPLPRAEARARLNLPDDRHLVLFVGRIEPLKGIDTLLQAISRLVQSSPSWKDRLHLYIIGGDFLSPGEEGERQEFLRLRQLYAELGLSEQVSFLGAKEQEILPWYYSAADVVVMPSFYESFGMVALEAMACGTPVIASRVGGLAQLVQDGKTGFLVSPGDSASLADKLARLLQDDGLRAEMGAQASSQARQYAWPKVAPQITKLYRQLICRQCRVRCAFQLGCARER
ncbi:MAG: glycosyltransferase [Anaerolineae bacterium]